MSTEEQFMRAQMRAQLSALVLEVERLKPEPPNEAEVVATVEKFEAGTWKKTHGVEKEYRNAMENRFKLLRDRVAAAKQAQPQQQCHW